MKIMNQIITLVIVNNYIKIKISDYYNYYNN